MHSSKLLELDTKKDDVDVCKLFFNTKMKKKKSSSSDR